MVTLQYRDLGPDHEVYASFNGETVGNLVWSKKTRVVRIAWVHPDLRGRGIGTQMWEHSQQLNVPAPKHSRDRTESGKRWIASLSARK